MGSGFGKAAWGFESPLVPFFLREKEAVRIGLQEHLKEQDGLSVSVVQW